MISIIISYYDRENFGNVSANITETCGEIFEIIGVYNPGKYSIGEAYNSGRNQSQYPFLLFLHDDVRFLTKNWGSCFTAHLKDENTGIIGIAGSNYVPVAPSGWFVAPETKVQGNKIKSEALALDGVFLGITAENFDKLAFDENIPGFHGYDTDLSLRAAKLLTNFVVTDIKIEHFSSGNPDKLWLDNNIYIRKKVGSNFQNLYDKTLEKTALLKFISYYYKFYPFNLKSIKETLQFLPKNLGLSGYLEIMLLYLSFFKLKMKETL